MNIQIFGKSKCFETKKGERYFMERSIKFQVIDVTKFGMSKGEYQSVKSAMGGIDALIDEKSKEYVAQCISHIGGKMTLRNACWEILECSMRLLCVTVKKQPSATNWIYGKVGLTYSVGIGFSMMSAKLASEEKKSNRFFEIPTPEPLRWVIIDSSIRTIYGVGAKTANELRCIGIITVRQLYENPTCAIALRSNHGTRIIELAEGIDNRKVTLFSEAKSICTEQTFQQDTTDFAYLKDVLLLTARKRSFDVKLKGIYANTITLKVTYHDMKSTTRAKSVNPPTMRR
jgi:glutaredoxin